MIATWILVLTLSAPATSGGNAIHSVAGFPDANSCEASGAFWKKNLPKTWSYSSFVCISIPKDSK